MSNVDDNVLEAYEEIFALESDEQVVKAIANRWNALRNSCTEESRCAECLKEMEAQSRWVGE